MGSTSQQLQLVDHTGDAQYRQSSGKVGSARFEPLFYHKSFDRFVPWEQREKVGAVEGVQESET